MIRALLERLSGDRDYEYVLAIAQEFREVVHEQRDIITRKNAEIDALNLEHARNTRDLLERFLVAVDHPEIDVREPILIGLRDLSDEIARMEEFLTA